MYPHELSRLEEYDGGSLFLNLCLMSLSTGVSTFLGAKALPDDDPNHVMFMHATIGAVVAFVAFGMATYFVWKSRRTVASEVRNRAKQDQPNIRPPATSG